MTSPTPEFDPVRVHISGSDLAKDIGLQRPQRMTASPRTVVLSAGTPLMPLCGHEPNRALVKVMAIDNPVIISDSSGQAGQAGNTAVGLLNPEGAYLPVGTQYTDIPTTDQMWVSAATFPSRVSVITISYAEQ